MKNNKQKIVLDRIFLEGWNLVCIMGWNSEHNRYYYRKTTLTLQIGDTPT